ncbi:exonuclease 3'-5' domain-containing protein 2 isoform X1 [Palaemon carinicauda]|uniref:exonuclease 3'-5' domain-containing protein 2 isoform X1 n=1 Tax=Palaemon carinicauda TaxID=392227 RepID=UPI0035B64E63
MVMRNWVQHHPAFVASTLLGGACAGAIFYHRKAIGKVAHSWRLLRSVLKTNRRVHVVTSREAWNKIEPLLLSEAKSEGAVGFDCEWVQVRGRRRPVALLQLATCSGMCVLVRLCHMKSDIPDSLKDFLKDEDVLKVGVGPLEDSNYLYGDYNFEVRGCVDLRHLWLRCQDLDRADSDEAIVKSKGGMGLNALAEKYLGRTLDKDWRVRASDWEADTLTTRQENYAAEDALVGIHILMMMVEKLWNPEPPTASLLPAPLWNSHLRKQIHHICRDYCDVKFSSKKDQDSGIVPNPKQHPASKVKAKTGRNGIRKGPLYHNCQLWAPDNKPLCTIDPKKARWYVEKDLGDLVSEDPLIVRLKFEPAGRPQMEMEDGKFYLQERQNICVVCGKEESFIRKNVVPREYRKYFPDTLKAHQNHDVVLLCSSCHRLNNMRDQQLRFKLAEEFDAPIGTEQDVKCTFDKSLKSVRYAAGALLRSRDEIPQKRVLELENIVKKFYDIDEITQEHLNKAYNMNVNIWNDDYQAHGYKVFQAYEKVGLVKLEQRWREFFLSSMEPKFLPDCWSVTHNAFKMRLKMSRLPVDHPDREKYRIVLVGTEGTIDVPYIPDLSRESTPVGATSNSLERDVKNDPVLNGAASGETEEDYV